jgi:hypothetical protein
MAVTMGLLASFKRFLLWRSKRGLVVVVLDRDASRFVLRLTRGISELSTGRQASILHANYMPVGCRTIILSRKKKNSHYHCSGLTLFSWHGKSLSSQCQAVNKLWMRNREGHAEQHSQRITREYNRLVACLV